MNPSTITLLVTILIVGIYIALTIVLRDHRVIRKVLSVSYGFFLGLWDIFSYVVLSADVAILICGIFLLSYSYVESIGVIVKYVKEEN